MNLPEITRISALLAGPCKTTQKHIAVIFFPEVLGLLSLTITK